MTDNPEKKPLTHNLGEVIQEAHAAGLAHDHVPRPGKTQNRGGRGHNNNSGRQHRHHNKEVPMNEQQQTQPNNEKQARASNGALQPYKPNAAAVAGWAAAGIVTVGIGAFVMSFMGRLGDSLGTKITRNGSSI